MGQTPAGPIRDRAAARVCNLSGISLAKEQLITFMHLKQGIVNSLRDLESDTKRAQFVDNAFVVVKFTKLTCDAFIGLAAELTKLAPGGVLEKQAKLVKAGYGATGAVAD